MPSTRNAADLPPIPTFAAARNKPPSARNPLEEFVYTYFPYCNDAEQAFRARLTAAIHWYMDEHQRLWRENMDNKRREELAAGLDHAAKGEE
jgi:hypothetical protein